MRDRVWYTQQHVGNWPRHGREFVKSAAIFGALVAVMLCWAPAAVSAAALPLPVQGMQQPVLEQEEAPTADDDTEEEPQAEEISGIADLHVTAARLRGRVELGWRVGEEAIESGLEGGFVVERSTNGGTWRAVKACAMHFDPDQAEYGCTDSRLTSGTTYAYRVCITAKGSTCANAVPSQPVTVKAP